MANLNDFLWLTTRKGLFKPSELYFLLRYFGTPERIFLAEKGEFDQFHLTPSQKAALLDKDLHQAEHIQAECDRLNIRIMTIQDADYPIYLKQIKDPPCVLYLKGRPLSTDDALTVGVVGTRSCTPYGVQVAEMLGLDLAHSGVTLVSGIARGIDGASIRGALYGGGRVISVLGGGIDVPFPSEHRFLYDDVAIMGTLVSEYPPGTINYRQHFPVRNRIISGLSQGVVVVEAPERSGALITARLALEQNRDVFAFPGPVNSAASVGCNRLIQRSEAKLIFSAADVLADFQFFLPFRTHAVNFTEYSEPEPVSAPPAHFHSSPKRLDVEKEVDKESERAYISLSENPNAFTDDQQNILAALKKVPLTVDELTDAVKLPVRQVASELTVLQVQGFVEEHPGKRFSASVVLVP